MEASGGRLKVAKEESDTEAVEQANRSVALTHFGLGLGWRLG